MKKLYYLIKKYIKPISVFLLAVIIAFALWAISINIRNVNKTINYFNNCTHEIVDTTVSNKNFEQHSNFFDSYYDYYIISEADGVTYVSNVSKEIYEHYKIGDKIEVCKKHQKIHLYEDSCS